MKLLTYDDLGDAAILLLNAPYAPSFCRSDFFIRKIGDVDYLLRAGRRRVVEDGLSRAFEDTLSRAEIRDLAKQYFHRRWRGRAGSWQMIRHSAVDAREARLDSISVEGLEHLENARERAGGAILWSSPFGAPSDGVLVIQRKGFPLTVVEGPAHGGAFSWVGQRFFRKQYAANSHKLLDDVVRIDDSSTSYLSALVKRLRNNAFVWMGNVGTSGRLFFRISFLGRLQLFAGGVAGLAALTGVPLIPAFCYRHPSKGRLLELGEPIKVRKGAFRPEDLAPVVRAHARLLESYIRQYPLQWSMWHAPLDDSRVADIDGVTILNVAD